MTKKGACNNCIQHMIEAVYLNRAEEVYVASFAIYFDDSGTSPSQDVAVAAGWIAPMPIWMLFEREWDEARNVEGDKFICMHMADFVSGLGEDNEFRDWELDKKQRVAARLRELIKQRALKGFALGVVKRDYDQIVPAALKAEGFENHYTYAIRRVLGMIDEWRQKNMKDQPIEYVFDWQDRNDPRRKEIERVFSWAEGQDEAFRRYGITKGGLSFRKRQDLPPLQAADMFAWTVYRAVLNEVDQKPVHPIAHATFKDFYLHRNRGFIEGGYNRQQDLIDWVKAKHPTTSAGTRCIFSQGDCPPK
jgi:hypothetical protein